MKCIKEHNIKGTRLFISKNVREGCVKNSPFIRDKAGFHCNHGKAYLFLIYKPPFANGIMVMDINALKKISLHIVHADSQTCWPSSANGPESGT